MLNRFLFILIMSFLMVSLSAYTLTYLSETAESVVLELDLSETEFITTGEYSTIQLKKALSGNEPESPDLPQILLHFAVPVNGSISVSINEINRNHITLQKPIRPVGIDITGTENTTIYRIDTQKYNKPSAMYEILPSQAFHQYELVPLRINPYQYNHSQRRIEYPQKIILRVDIHGDLPQSMTARNTEHNSTKRQRPDIVADMIVNSKYGLNFTHTRDKEYHTSDFSRSHIWYRMEITQNGMHQLDYSQLSNLDYFTDLDLNTVRIFSTGGAMTLPYYTDTGNTFEEIPLQIIDQNGNGRLDSGDKIYFYARQRDGYGMNTPIQNGTNPIGDYFMNPYSKNGIYWMTFGGTFSQPPKRMPISSITTAQRERSIGRIQTHYEMPRMMIHTEVSGFDWFSHMYLGGSTQNYTENLEDFNATLEQTFKAVVRTSSRLSSSVTFRVNNSILTTRQLPCSNLVENPPPVLISETGNYFQPGQNTITIEAGANSIYLRYYAIEWYKNLVKRNNALHFLVYNRSISDTDHNVPVRYNISNPNNQSLTAYQIDDFNITTRLPISGNQFIASATRDGRFYICAEGDYLNPVSITSVNPRKLDITLPSCDVMIIYPEEFAAGAQRLATIYETHNGYRYSVLCVTLEDIYDNFAGGCIDPMAIRNWLHYYSQKNDNFIGATFLGSGSIDFRNYTGQAGTKNKFPVNQIRHQSGTSTTTVYTSDDFYANLTHFSYPQLIIGRIPAHTTDQLTNYLNKLEEYLRIPRPGWWQYKFVMLADDQYGGDSDTESIHTEKVEEFGELLRNHIIADKIFAIEHEMDPFRQKPQVKNMLVDALNDGRLYWLYIGHGSIRNTGDEKYFGADVDIPLLISGDANRGKYSIYFTASCDVGKFEHPSITSLCEELLLTPNKGTIISIGATGKSGILAGPQLVRSFLSQSFVRNSVISPGEALMLAKQQNTLIVTNNNYYNILGDPFLKVAYPTTSDNITFTTPAPPDTTLLLRQTVSVEGHFDKPGLNNDAYTLVYGNDFSKSVVYAYNSEGEPLSVSFTRENLPIFTGSVAVDTSRYDFRFVIPDDAASGNRGKILTMLTDENGVYIDKKNSIYISTEIDSTKINNTDSPEIEIFLTNRRVAHNDDISDIKESFLTGSKNFAPIDLTLVAEISDNDGINITGNPGHHIMIYLSGSTEPINATSGFQYDRGSHTKGKLIWQLSGITPGQHNVKVIAYDSFNSVSVADENFTVGETIPIKIENALVYPNPIKRDGGYFTFRLSHKADITINIYTITGRKIHTIHSNNKEIGFNQIPWNGRDADGHFVANNTYFYTIKANAIGGKGSAEIREKVMVLR